MFRLLGWLGPYLVAALIGAAVGGEVTATMGARRLAEEQTAHARDDERHAEEMKAATNTALAAERKMVADRNVALQRIDLLNAQLTEESEKHEDENRRLRDALASGTERVRVAVTHCSAGRHSMPGSAGTARMDDGGAPVADLAPAVAQRVFGVAGDDQHEIDKLMALQGYVCSLRPTTSACHGHFFP